MAAQPIGLQGHSRVTRPWHMPDGRQVSSALLRNLENQVRPHLDKAWLVTANFMAGELHGLSGSVSPSAILELGVNCAAPV